MSRTVIEGARVVTVDADRTEHAGRARRRRGQPDHRGRRRAGARRVRRDADVSSTAAAACSPPAWSTPTTTSTSGRPAGWPSTPRCSSGSPRSTRCGPASTRTPCAPARPAALAWLARTGCTTSTDHHYVFPRDGGDLLGAEIEAARDGRAAVPPDPRLDGPRPQPGRAAAGLRGRGHRRDPRRHRAPRSTATTTRRPDSMLRVARRAVLAVLGHRRADDARPPSWPAAAACGCTPTSPRPTTRRSSAASGSAARPVEYVESLGWLGDDVWLAHAVHLDDAAVVAARPRPAPAWRTARRRNARLGAGIAPHPRPARRRRARSGSASTAPRRNEAGVAGRGAAARGAVRPGRRRPAGADRPRRRCELATLGGARVLGRDDEIGSLEAGKLADLALWRLDTAAARRHRRPGRRAGARLAAAAGAAARATAGRWSSATRW